MSATGIKLKIKVYMYVTYKNEIFMTKNTHP